VAHLECSIGLWQSSDTAFEWNDAISELLHILR